MKYVNFGDFSKNRARDLQTPCKSIGTSLATFLTLFWTLGRLRRPRAPIRPPPELLALLPASIDQPPWIGLNMVKNHGFIGFSRFFGNLGFRRKMKVVKSVQKRFYGIQGMRTRSETTPESPGTSCSRLKRPCGMDVIKSSEN